jgi:hypothetical protein
MSSNFNNAKIINVYYNKGDRKPYDVNGKPIAYIGEEFVGANEATELRFYFGEELDSASAIIVAKRANNDTRLDPLELVGTGVNSYFKVRLNAWYGEYKGKMTIIFKVYNGTVTYDDAENPTEITATTGQIIVSDIFNLEVAYAPNASSLVPPFATEDYDDWFFTLSTKLDKAQSITVTGALPTLTGDVYDDRYFYVENEGTGRLYYINGSTAIEVVFQVGTLKLSATGGDEVTTNTGKVAFDTTYGGFKYTQIRDVVGYIGQDVEYYGKAVGTIAKGDVIQFDGVDGVHFLIKKAVPADVNANPEIILGIAKQGLTNGQFGYILHFGRITGIDLTAYADENYLWFASASANNGELTVTEPTAPNAKILMGVVVDNGASGTLLVRPLIQPSLKDLKDIHITSIANNQVLRWNNTNLRWENTSALTTAETDIANIEDGTTIVGKANADKDGNEFDATYLKKASASSTYVPLSSKGVANGVAPLDSNNKIPSIHLPGGVDDIKEFANLASFPATGEASIIYVALDTNIIYRWSGSAYVEISSSLALGTTSSTAFPGDRGLATETQSNTLNTAVNIAGQVNTQIPYWNSTNSRFESDPQLTFNPTLNRLVAYQALIQNNFYTETISTANGSPSANIALSTTGTTISRNINDTNAPLKVNKVQGTGNILQLQSAGANKLEIDVNGWIYKNGVKFLHSIGGNVNSNIALGYQALNVNSTGSNNVAIGFRSLVANNNLYNTGVGWGSLESSTGQTNTALGNGSGRNITTGNQNTFLGNSSGETGGWGTQLATASNSTALGYQSFTDKSNQMVFGNASVTEFKFDRNASAVALLPQTQISGATFPVLQVERTTTGTNSFFGSTRIQATTSGDMVDGFGPSVNFSIKDNAATSEIGTIRFVRSGGDTSGRFIISTRNAGTDSEKMTILPNGNVGVGTTSPTGYTNYVSLQIGDNSASKIGLLKFASSYNSGNGAELYQGTNGDFIIQANGSARIMTMTASGLVGINENSPTAQLQVKSGATNRVPLIVDTLASHATLLQEWRINGTANSRITSTGYFSGLGLLNFSDSNNGSIVMLNAGTTISRNIADTNPALIVNLANASATGNIQVWQKAGTALARIDGNGSIVAPYIYNNASINNSYVNLRNTGTLIGRNINDTNSVLTINQANSNATGDILKIQKEGVDVYAFTHDGTLKAPATFTIDPSTHGNATGKVIILGDLQVDGTTTTINSTTLEVDDKNIELSKGAANKAASDGAGISIDLGTDGEANLTYGATDDIFNLNKGLNIAGQTQISSASSSLIERTTTITSGTFTPLLLKFTTTGDMTDGFGSSLTFQIRDSANVDNSIARVGAVRSGADNSGRLSFITFNAGTDTEKMTILPNGNVGIGTASPATTVEIRSADPVLRFTNTSNTGQNEFIGSSGNMIFKADMLNSVSNSNFRFDLDGTEVMKINTGGNVGIGTGSPNRRLSVSASGETIPLQINNASTTAGQFALIRSVISTDQDNIASSVDFGGIRTASSNADFIVRTNATERLRILNSGNVGIGTNSPAEILHISGSAGPRIEHTADRALGFVRTGANTFTFEHDTARFYLYNTTTAVSPILFNNNGTVGINETAPSAQLQVKSGATDRVGLVVNSLTGQTANLQEWQVNSSNLLFVASNGVLRSNTGLANANAFNNSYINSSTTGTTISRNINDANVVLKVQQANASATGDLQQWIYGTNTYAYVDKDGDFYNSSGSYGQISDLRVKENIVEARDYTEDLMKLRVVKYSLKKDQEQEATKLGFIAQEVEAVFPNMVETTETDEIKDLKSIKMSVLIPMLVKTIQQLNERVKELEKK